MSIPSKLAREIAEEGFRNPNVPTIVIAQKVLEKYWSRLPRLSPGHAIELPKDISIMDAHIFTEGIQYAYNAFMAAFKAEEPQRLNLWSDGKELHVTDSKGETKTLNEWCEANKNFISKPEQSPKEEIPEVEIGKDPVIIFSDTKRWKYDGKEITELKLEQSPNQSPKEDELAKQGREFVGSLDREQEQKECPDKMGHQPQFSYQEYRSCPTCGKFSTFEWGTAEPKKKKVPEKLDTLIVQLNEEQRSLHLDELTALKVNEIIEFLSEDKS